MPQITVSPSHTVFAADEGETILHAALRHGHNLPHACQSGVCGSCRARLLSGSVVPHGTYDDYVLTEAERASGLVLLCCSRAESDVQVDMPAYAGAKAVSIRTLPARVATVDVRGDVAVVRVALPKAPPFVFYAGQYMEILLKDGSRSYSIANAPSDNAILEFHIRHHEGGLFSPMLFDGRLKSGAIIRLRGPLGGFILDAQSQKPLIFLATGTGFAPIKSMLSHLAETDCQRSVHLYHGVRTEAELYDQAALSALLDKLPAARYTPVLSRPDVAWTGQTGYIQEAAAQDYPDLSAHEVYACGSPAMIQAARVRLHQCALPEQAFFSDAFVAGVCFNSPGCT